MTRSSAGNDNGVGIHFRPARGLSLLEVVLAMAILAAAMAVLSQLVGLGLRAAGQSRDWSQNQRLPAIGMRWRLGWRPALRHRA